MRKDEIPKVDRQTVKVENGEKENDKFINFVSSLLTYA